MNENVVRCTKWRTVSPSGAPAARQAYLLPAIAAAAVMATTAGRRLAWLCLRHCTTVSGDIGAQCVIVPLPRVLSFMCAAALLIHNASCRAAQSNIMASAWRHSTAQLGTNERRMRMLSTTRHALRHVAPDCSHHRCCNDGCFPPFSASFKCCWQRPAMVVWTGPTSGCWAIRVVREL